ncbi:TetR/AcrR family transcriptional regulator [uncultured Jatrophihabitans sp.]|uniref:TetR/AcrR family transcriptional regulator n=1 Tax=uncultured Jatrophihabitans sp. TaxID=1610747 RepID=UPI0035CA1352
MAATTGTSQRLVPQPAANGAASSAREKLTAAVLAHLLDGGSAQGSLRSFAAAAGVSHSLVLYHFGSTSGLLAAVHLACEQREREHLSALQIGGAEPVAVMRAMWKHLAQPRMWPVYRLGFTLRLRADVPVTDQDGERDAWITTLQPLMSSFGLTPARARAEAILWVATCRGLLWELVTGADPRRIHQAAERFFAHYHPGAPGQSPRANSS